MDKLEKTSEYIKASWHSAVKRRDANGFALPFDYVPPCIDGELTDLYYWDTYFTNLGLFCDGLDRYAIGNIENLKFCLRREGKVPNMCRENGAELASQPPLLSMMVADAYERTQDKAFLQDSFEALLQEYTFWMTERISPNGLNRYGTNCRAEERLKEVAFSYAARVGKDISAYSDGEKIACAKNCIAEGESGEDHTRRFFGAALDINPIDLNCHLYTFERNMARFSDILENGQSGTWLARAQERLGKIRAHCYDAETGVYFDYNYVSGKRTGIYCAACYMPYVAGICSDREALDKINQRLLRPHGVVSCEELPPNGETYQWGYPNVWAPHNYFAYLANLRAGNGAVAQEIVGRYLLVVADTFEAHGKLYEKYDALAGGKALVNEYGTPEMLGWTAGVYQYFYKTIARMNGGK